MDRLVSDDQLIMRVASADTVALEALFTRHQTRIFRFIARIVRDEAAAEELTNEVFVGGASAQGRVALTRPRSNAGAIQLVLPGHSSLPCADCVNLSAMPGIHVLTLHKQERRGWSGIGERKRRRPSDGYARP